LKSLAGSLETLRVKALRVKATVKPPAFNVGLDLELPEGHWGAWDEAVLGKGS
jgi:hypothetical protein